MNGYKPHWRAGARVLFLVVLFTTPGLLIPHTPPGAVALPNSLPEDNSK